MVNDSVPQQIIEAFRLHLAGGKHVLGSLPCVFNAPKNTTTSEVDRHENVLVEVGREINSSDTFDDHAADAGSDQNRLSTMSPRLVSPDAVFEFTLIDVHRLVAG